MINYKNLDKIHFDISLDTTLISFSGSVDTISNTVKNLKNQYTEEEFDYLMGNYLQDLYKMWNKEKNASYNWHEGFNVPENDDPIILLDDNDIYLLGWYDPSDNYYYTENGVLEPKRIKAWQEFRLYDDK